MEELLIPADADETGEPGRPGTADSVKEALQSACGASVRTYLKQYVKRNGLLTLSVLGVGTGCVLGYMLRGLEMSTQVRGLTGQHWTVGLSHYRGYIATNEVPRYCDKT
ncbi:hypothetical protein MHYP_G00227920 [Metynnis hypsauchen]